MTEFEKGRERRIEEGRLELCYKKLGETLAQTYGVPPPTVEFSWKMYADFGVVACYYPTYHIIAVTYDTHPYNFAHEFKHYLQDIVEGKDFSNEVYKEFYKEIREGKKPDFSRVRRLSIEKEACRFGEEYGKLIGEEGTKIYGSHIWVTALIRDELRKGEIPDYVITAFRRKVE